MQSIHAIQPKMQDSVLLALGEAQLVEIQMLRSLRFSTMDHRQVEISAAHETTFRWIFDETLDEARPWSNFVKWLKIGNGIYWINGKAGSGKSTLMRYIVNNERTRQCLYDWAQGTHLDLGTFFFWDSGSLEQRSQAGLFRSLLYQALHRRPNLVRHIFPTEWAENSSILDDNGLIRFSWPLASLKAGFKRWLDFASDSSKLCFFIDGLDEYDGDHEDIAAFFKTISSFRSSNIKICVTSRPWVVFEEAFGGLSGLRLQDLTFYDIKAYVDSELYGHRRMKLLARAEPEQAAELVNEIVMKASGVFLWVTVVVKSLLRGLMNRDRIKDLRGRLRDLPSDLTSMYTHMMYLVEPCYREQAARTFQIFGAFCSEDIQQDQQITALELELAIAVAHPETTRDNLAPMDEAEIFSRCQDLDVHLKTRCAGLLEVHDNRLYETQSDDRPSTAFLNSSGQLAKVGYLHRTVKDFLKSEDALAFLSKATNPNFNANISITTSYITWLRRAVFIDSHGRLQSKSNSRTWKIIIKAMQFARKADTEGKKDYSDIIDQLGNAGLLAWENDVDPWGTDYINSFYRYGRERWDLCDKPQKWQRNFLGEAVTQGLNAYIEAKVKQEKSLILDPQTTPLLLYAFRVDYARMAPIEAIVKLLIALGANPNQLWHGNSPWQHFLTRVHGRREFWPPEVRYDILAVFKSMIQHGASIHTTCKVHHSTLTSNRCRPGIGPHSVEAVIDDAFGRACPAQAAELYQLVAAQRRPMTPWTQNSSRSQYRQNRQ